jgi:hypothetical protein
VTSAKEAPALTVRDLQPADGTSAAIRAAFFRLKDARLANDNEIARLVAVRPNLLLSASPAEIDRADEALRRRRVYVEQLDLLEKTLRDSFTVAKEAEEDRDYGDKLAQVKVIEAAWNNDLQTKYPELATAIMDLLHREKALLAAYEDLAMMPGGARVPHGDNARFLASDMQKAFSGPHDTPSTFADRVHLPSLRHGPALWRGKW